MAAAYKDVTVRVWLETRHHEDDPEVLPGDWRDPSVYINMDGARMVSRDTKWTGHESGSAAEPDYSQGCYLEGPGSTQPHLMEFGGKPPEPFLSALLKGLVMRGPCVAEDQQRHGV